jgi:hypothetical protein
MFTKESPTIQAVGEKTITLCEAARVVGRLVRMGGPAVDVESMADFKEAVRIYLEAVVLQEGDNAPKFEVTEEAWGLSVTWIGSWTADRWIQIAVEATGETRVLWNSGTGNPSRFLATII